MIRKAALQIGVPALLALIAWNAQLAVTHLKRVEKSAALTPENSAPEAELSGILKRCHRYGIEIPVASLFAGNCTTTRHFHAG
jgi:hypothetical protein